MFFSTHNFKGYKKTKESKDSATLAHPDGHSVTIAIKALKPEHRKALKDLPLHMDEGGAVDDAVAATPTETPKEDSVQVGTAPAVDSSTPSFGSDAAAGAMAAGPKGGGGGGGGGGLMALAALADGGQVELDPTKVADFTKGFTGQPQPTPQPKPQAMAGGGSPSPVERAQDLLTQDDIGSGAMKSQDDAAKATPFKDFLREGLAQEMGNKSPSVLDGSAAMGIGAPVKGGLVQNALPNVAIPNQAADQVQPPQPDPSQGTPAPAIVPPSDQTEPAQPIPGAGFKAPADQANPDVNPDSLAGQANLRANSERQLADMSPDEQKAAMKQHFDTEDRAWAHDLQNGHISPKTYSDLFHDKSTLGKIGMLFGVMMSGAGSGLAHQSNYALDAMNQQIERDLKAQVQSKDNAMNFVKMNQKHQMDLAQMNQMGHQNKLTDTQAKALAVDNDIKSRTFAQMQMARAALHKQTLTVQNMPEGPDKQKAMMQLGFMGQAVDASNANLADLGASKAAFLNAMMGQASGGSDEQAFQNRTRGMRMMGMEPMAKDMESKHYPGVGQASVPLSSEDRSFLQSGQGFQNSLDNFINWTSQHSGSLNPATVREGRTMAADLQGQYRQATHGGVYKEGEQNFISKLIDEDPTKFFNSIRVLPQLKAISEDNQRRLQSYQKGLGFPAAQSNGPQSGGETRVMHGATYQRVPGGWQKVR